MYNKRNQQRRCSLQVPILNTEFLSTIQQNSSTTGVYKPTPSQRSSYKKVFSKGFVEIVG